MKYLPIIGLTVALVCYTDLAVAKTPAQVEAIAKAVTVEIRLLKDESIGSGIIIDRKGDIHTLVTNRHVVCGQTRNCTTPPEGETYTVKLDDGQEYKVAAKSVKILGGNLDLAIIQFRSNRTYPVAQIDDAGSLKTGDAVYTSGYPATPPGFSFNAGKAIAVVNKRLAEDRGGYTVIYDAQTQPGMSGGGVFSDEGLLVAVHGQGERYQDNTQLETVSSSDKIFTKEEVGSKIGFNRGIPVLWVIKGLAERGKLGNRQLVNLGQTAANSADEHFITGFNKFVEPGTDVVAGKRVAVNEFSRAIKINPNYTAAYFMRAVTYKQLRGDRQAVADYDRVIALDDSKNAAPAYLNRGNLKFDSNPQGSLADYDRAISLDPKDSKFYNNRGTLKKDKLNNHQGALSDFDRAISLNPQDPTVHYNRGLLKWSKLNDFQGALSDYDRAISLNPKYVAAYINRGILKKDKLNDPQGALSDYDHAITLNPKNALAYTNRGNLKYDKFNNTQGALADFDRAIALDPKLSIAYRNRGLLKYTVGDRSGGIADVRQAARLARKHGNAGYLQLAIQALQYWGVGE